MAARNRKTDRTQSSKSARNKKSRSAAKRETKASPRTSQRKSKTRRLDEGDIIQLVLADHKPLKQLIKVMKNTDNSLADRRSAFHEFGPALLRHARPEEQVLYMKIKTNEDMRPEGFEGDVEHGLADQMLEEAKRTQDEDLWSARVKVLAELVEHHIEEEEETLLPEYRKNSDVEERKEIGAQFLAAKENVLPDGTEIRPAMKPAELKSSSERQSSVHH